MTHHTAKANLEKGSSWPPEAILYCHSFRVAFYYPKVPNPHLGPGLEGRWGQSLRYDSIIKKGCESDPPEKPFFLLGILH